MAEILGGDPRNGGGSRLLHAAVWIVKEVIDRGARFAEAGAGELNFEVADTIEEVGRESIEEIILPSGIIKTHEVYFRQKRHGVTNFKGRLNRI